MYSIIASMALMASTVVAQSVGSAVVVNMCNYDVFLANVPAQGNGMDETDLTLSSGANYTTQWTELNVGGWSIKLSKDATNWSDNILQYEYTFDNDGIIWYDLSAVNGNPWDKNWEVTAASEDSVCTPKQQAYRYATDDAYGMQSCPQDAVITVTLCSGEEQNDGGAASASSSVAAVTSSQATATSVSIWSTPTSDVPTMTSNTATADPSSKVWSPASSSDLTSSVEQTTFATMVSSSATVTTDPAGVTVTEVATAIVTEVATITHWWHHPHQGPPSKRHAHNA